MTAARSDVLAELAALIAEGELSAAVCATYPIERVQEAYTALAGPHSRGRSSCGCADRPPSPPGSGSNTAASARCWYVPGTTLAGRRTSACGKVVPWMSCDPKIPRE